MKNGKENLLDDEYPEPWYQVTDEGGRALLEEELKNEIGEGHPLNGIPVGVLARRDDRDDVLVTLDDGENGRIAEVHLTWSGKTESNPDWPRTVIYKSIGEWRYQARADAADEDGFSPES